MSAVALYRVLFAHSFFLVAPMSSAGMQHSQLLRRGQEAEPEGPAPPAPPVSARACSKPNPWTDEQSLPDHPRAVRLHQLLNTPAAVNAARRRAAAAGG